MALSLCSAKERERERERERKRQRASEREGGTFRNCLLDSKFTLTGTTFIFLEYVEKLSIYAEKKSACKIVPCNFFENFGMKNQSPALLDSV